MTDRPKAGKVPSPTVVVAQLVESQIVILDVAGSSPVGHPIFFSIGIDGSRCLPHFSRVKFLLSVVCVVAVAGCVVIPGKRVSFNDIKIGMSRAEAVAVLGKPHRVSAKGNVEHLYYNESALYIGILGVGKDPKSNRDLEVRLVDGKVESFGEVGEHFEEPLEGPDKE